MSFLSGGRSGLSGIDAGQSRRTTRYFGGYVKKSKQVGALFVAGAFVLSGCGSSDGDAEAAPGASASATSAPTATPTPSLSVGQEQYTGAELEAALAAAQEELGLTGEISGDAALRPTLTDGGLGSGGVTVTPERCMEILGFASFFGDLENAVVAGLTFGERDKITLVSHADVDEPQKQVDSNNEVVDECADFEMRGQEEGQVAQGVVEELDASTQAPTTQAYSFSVSAEGTTLSGLKVSAVSGTTNVSVTSGDAEDAEATLARAEEIIDAVLSQLEQD